VPGEKNCSKKISCYNIRQISTASAPFMDWGRVSGGPKFSGGGSLKFIGKGFVYASVGLVLVDAASNGLERHHIAEIGITGIIYGIAELSGPVGWVLGGAYFFGKLVYANYHDGHSITEYLFK
jgi:hypothetical protein